MNLAINGVLGERFPISGGKSGDNNNEFLSAVLDIVESKRNISNCNYFSGTTIISPKFEQRLEDDSELREAFYKKLSSMAPGCGRKDCRGDTVVVARDGNIFSFCFEREKERFKKPTSEELKAVAKARARKRAKLSAYFRRLQRYGIKRKLVEQENAKRVKGKKYRSISKLNTITDSLTTIQLPSDPDLIF